MGGTESQQLEDLIAEVEGEKLEVIFMEDWDCGCGMTAATTPAISGASRFTLVRQTSRYGIYLERCD